MGRRRWSVFLEPMLAVAGCVAILGFAVRAKSQTQPSPREQLQQYVTQLQSSPSNDALRTKIIQLALTLDPRPEIPTGAIEHEGAAEYAFKHAQSPADFTSAAAEYEQALLLAPWNAGDYYNLGMCYEKANEQPKAIAAYQLYLLAAPNAKDTDQVTKQIGALKYQLTQKDAAQTAQRQQEEAQQRQEQEQQREQAELQNQWSGTWRITGGAERVQQFRGVRGRWDNYYLSHVKFDISGDEITETWCQDRSDSYGNGPGRISSRKGHVSGRIATFTAFGETDSLQINSNGEIEDNDARFPGEIPFIYSRVSDPGSTSSVCPW